MAPRFPCRGHHGHQDFIQQTFICGVHWKIRFTLTVKAPQSDFGNTYRLQQISFYPDIMLTHVSTTTEVISSICCNNLTSKHFAFQKCWNVLLAFIFIPFIEIKNYLRSCKRKDSVLAKTLCKTFYSNNFGDWNNRKQMLCITRFDIVFNEKHTVVLDTLASHAEAQFSFKMCDNVSLNNWDTCTMFLFVTPSSQKADFISQVATRHHCPVFIKS